MKSITCSLLTISLIFLSGTLISQDTIRVLDQVYGLDQTLYNGKKYSYTTPLATNGNQYLFSRFYCTGSVTLRGKCYQNIALNYDIFNQQLLLQYADDKGPLNILEVSKAWLNGFSLGSMNFELLSLEENPHFYQVLGDEPFRVLYFYRKNLNLSDIIGAYNFVFTSAIRDSYVLIDGKLKPYNNNRSLVKLFNEEKRAEIKSYLRKNNIKVKKASDKTMADMINYIGSQVK